MTGQSTNIGGLLDRLDRACRERALHPYRLSSLTEKAVQLRVAFTEPSTAELGDTLIALDRELSLVESDSDDFVEAARGHFDRILAMAFEARAAERLDDGHVSRFVQTGIQALAFASETPAETTYTRMSALEAVVLKEIERNQKVGSELRARIHC